MNKRRHDKNHLGRRTLSMLLVLVTLVALCMPSSMALSDEGNEARSEQVVTVPEMQADAAEVQVDAQPTEDEDTAQAEQDAQSSEAAADADASSAEDESTDAPDASSTEDESADAPDAQPAEDENKSEEAADADQPQTLELNEADALAVDNSEIAVYAAAGSATVIAGSYTWLTGSATASCGYSTWESSDDKTATVNDSGRVKGVKAGTATITHTYCTNHTNSGRPSGRPGSNQGTHTYASETFTVTVLSTSGSEVEIYMLADPASNPESNETKYWAPAGNESTLLLGRVDTSKGSWNNNWVSNSGYKNIVDGVTKCIVAWPDGSTTTNWTVTADNPSFNYIRDAIFDGYQKSLSAKLGITVTKDDITEITLIPHKISRWNQCTNGNRGDKNGLHLDCTIDVKCKNVFTAKFWVKNPNATDYSLVDAANYKEGAQVVRTSKATIGSTITDDNGVVWTLDGWYAEDAAGGAYGNKVTRWNYSPSAAELADGTVNFYAHYTAQPVNVTVTKQVVGVNNDDTFTFNYTAGDTKDSFQLKNGESKNIKVPYGSTFTVTEEAFDGGTYTYTTTNTNGNGNTASISSVTAPQTITFTNTYAQHTGSLTLTKTIVNQDALTDAELDALKQNLSFTITDGTTDYTITGAQGTWTDNTFTYTWNDLPAGSTWTVTESNQNVDYVNVDTAYNPQSATVPVNGTASLGITNTYTPIMGSLTIDKTVTGSNSKPGSFTFTAVSKRTGITYTATIVTKDNGAATIDNIPAGEYTVTELENDNYVCKDGSVKTAIVNPSAAVSFTNEGTGDSFQDSSSVVNVGAKNGYHVKFTVKGKPEENSGDNTSEN